MSFPYIAGPLWGEFIGDQRASNTWLQEGFLYIMMKYMVSHEIDTRFVLCRSLLWSSNGPLKTKVRQFDNFTVTSGIVSCHYDN